MEREKTPHSDNLHAVSMTKSFDDFITPQRITLENKRKSIDVNAEVKVPRFVVVQQPYRLSVRPCLAK